MCCSKAQVTQIKHVVTRARNQAAQAQADPARTRSTRTRSAYKIKAEALEKVNAILQS